MSAFSANLLQYYTSQSSSEIYIQNMKNIHPSLNENDLYGLALLSVNPAISEEERQVFKNCLELKGKQIQKQLAEVGGVGSRRNPWPLRPPVSEETLAPYNPH